MGRIKGECSRPTCDRAIERLGLCAQHYRCSPNRGYINSARVKSRLNELHDAGRSWREVARMVGMTEQGLYYLLDRDRVRKGTATKIMWAAETELSRTALVDATGTVRRVNALAAVGWPKRAQAERLGISFRRLSALQKQSQVCVDTAIRVSSLFEELAMKPGPSDWSRMNARSKGWPPPLAWDDIDDPDERPDTGSVERVAYPELYREKRGLGRSFMQIAAEEGIAPDSLERKLMRYKIYEGKAS